MLFRFIFRFSLFIWVIGTSTELKAQVRYNTIILHISSLREDAVDLSKGNNKTPELARYSDRIVHFRNNHANSTIGMQSIGSFFTGRYPFSSGIKTHFSENEALKSDSKTLAEAFKIANYTTGFFGGKFCEWTFKNKKGFDRGFDTYNTKIDFWDESDLGPIGEWINKNSKTPFFLVIHSWRGHVPYHSFPEFGSKLVKGKDRELFGLNLSSEDLMGDLARIAKAEIEEPSCKDATKICLYDLIPWREVFQHEPKPQIQKDFFSRIDPYNSDHIMTLRSAYQASIRSLDKLIGQFLDDLGRQGHLDKSIIVITSDHGEEFMEYGGLDHFAINPATIMAPLLMIIPKELKILKNVVSAPTERVDIYPTLLELNGIEVPSGIDGLSLVGILKSGTFTKKPYRVVYNSIGSKNIRLGIDTQDAFFYYEDRKLMRAFNKKNDGNHKINVKNLMRAPQSTEFDRIVRDAFGNH
jgi:choline-sulfatase